MSDPQINIEIEDVLASIRRLVSEGEAPRRAAAPKRVTEAEVSKPRAPADVADVVQGMIANSPAAPEKLVLSPEQMISVPEPVHPPDKVQDDAPLLLMPQALPEETFDDAVEEGASMEAAEVVADDADEVAPLPAEHTDPAHTDSASQEHDETIFEAGPPAEEMWHSVRAPRPKPDEAVSGTAEKADLLSTIAELEAAVSDGSDEFEPDGSETTPVVDWAETTANGAIFGARASTTRILDLDGSGVSKSEGLAGGDKRSVVEEIEAEASVAEAVEDQAKERVVEAVLESATDDMLAGLDDDLIPFLDAETALDEEALREMVRDLIRQELQGALGERITRNVRKLVRREIYRVLSSEEFN